jgi:hypothetical protein
MLVVGRNAASVLYVGLVSSGITDTFDSISPPLLPPHPPHRIILEVPEIPSYCLDLTPASIQS